MKIIARLSLKRLAAPHQTSPMASPGLHSGQFLSLPGKAGARESILDAADDLEPLAAHFEDLQAYRLFGRLVLLGQGGAKFVQFSP